MKVLRTKYNANKVTGIQRETISNIINKTNPTIRIDYLLKIVEVVKKEGFDLENTEKHVTWIGDFRSQGIVNPKLPFNFNSREGARFLAAICNEGWISNGMYYSNSKSESRLSVKNDALKIFGGSEETIREYIKEKDKCLAFPSIMRDVINILTDFKGVKAENNPNIPSFILKNKELMYGWLEQTIGDEGHVKFYLDSYRREIIWRRACDTKFDRCNLIENELKILQKLGIKYDLKKIGNYTTSKGKERYRMQIRVSRKENLKRLANSIRIPNNIKDKKLIQMLKSC
ncbi:hypothetical protein HYW99_02245 [Candidatus Woesearchaeota archaeon]|nr:hypothetical protein [Candidatus Woesearchaeota archaeon]